MGSLSAYIITISNLTYEGLKQNKYLYSLVIFIAFFILSKLFVLITKRLFLRLAKHTKTELDDLILKKTNKPISLILILIGIKLAIIPLEIHAKFIDIINKTIYSLIVAIVTYTLTQIIYILIDHWKKQWLNRTKSRLDENLVRLLHRIAKYVLVIIGFLFILQGWGIKVGPLLASLGIAGVAVAFALQTTLGNIFGGVSLILDSTIKVGDVIKLDSGEIGTVKDIGIRSTKILTPDNIIISIPNGKLADSRLQNFSEPDQNIRAGIDIGVEYGSDTEKVKEIVLTELSKIKEILKEPKQEIFFTEMGDFALKFKVFFWVHLDKRLEITDLALARIYKALNRNKIGIPFPTRRVYLSSYSKVSE